MSWVEKLEESAVALRKEIAKLEKDLVVKKDSLRQLENLLDANSGKQDSLSVAFRSLNNITQPRRFTLADRIEDILGEAGASMHYRDIYKELKERGVEIGSQDPLTNVAAILSMNNERFAKDPLQRGYWHLVDPSKRKVSGNNRPDT